MLPAWKKTVLFNLLPTPLELLVDVVYAPDSMSATPRVIKLRRRSIEPLDGTESNARPTLDRGWIATSLPA
jgi:hypothetical protein